MKTRHIGGFLAALLLLATGFWLGRNSADRYEFRSSPGFLKIDKRTGKVWTYYGQADGQWRELR